MKHSLLFICSFIMILSHPVFAEFTLPDYQKLTLKNGLTVYLMEQHEVPLVDIKVVTKAGAVNDGDNYGLANFTGTALGFGSDKLSKKEIEDLFDFHGANFSNGVGMESSTLSLSIASKDIDGLLPVFRDILLAPSFDNEEFVKEKKRHLENLKQSREQPGQIIGGAFNQLYFQQHSLGNPADGNISTIEKLSIKQIETFYQAFYSANNSALIVVGDFNSKSMEKKINDLFSDWASKNISAPNLKSFKEPAESNVLVVNKSDANESTFIIGGKGIASNHPDMVAIKVINTILGGRFTSWLNDALRVNSGLTYGARSQFNSYSTAGTFVISTFTKNETTFEAIDLALKTYDRLWEQGIDQDTLESAKAYVKGQFPPKYETSRQLAGLLATMWVQQLDNTFINDFQQNVDALNVIEANEIVKTVFPRENLQLVIIGKADIIGEKAKKYGKVKEVDINTVSF
jgi:zinc protease